MGANTRLDRLSDYQRHNANVLVVCGCGHRGVLHAGRLQRWYFCHRWNDSIEVLGLYLRCSVCMGRPVRIRATPEKPDRPGWMALDGDWKRVVKALALAGDDAGVERWREIARRLDRLLRPKLVQ